MGSDPSTKPITIAIVTPKATPISAYRTILLAMSICALLPGERPKPHVGTAEPNNGFLEGVLGHLWSKTLSLQATSPAQVRPENVFETMTF